MSKKESNPSPPITKIQDKISVSFDELKKAFTEWDRRYREDPEGFQNEAYRLLNETPETYGDSCAPYFIKLINEIKTGS